MTTLDLPQEILARLRAKADPAFREKQQHFSKEEFRSLGLRTADTHQVAKESYPFVRGMNADGLFEACGRLFAEGFWEMDVVAIDWAWLHRKQLGPQHFNVLKGWLESHVHTWAGCDHLCCGILGELLRIHPQLLQDLPVWAESPNRWVRRGAGVVMIPSFRKSAEGLPMLFRVAEMLLPNPDDLVQKGYGWALKEACKQDEHAVFAFLMAHKARMPRTALRYAIEKMPDERKAAVSAKPRAKAL